MTKFLLKLHTEIENAQKQTQPTKEAFLTRKLSVSFLQFFVDVVSRK